jgi:hypothetical protein
MPETIESDGGAVLAVCRCVPACGNSGYENGLLRDSRFFATFS